MDFVDSPSLQAKSKPVRALLMSSRGQDDELFGATHAHEAFWLAVVLPFDATYTLELRRWPANNKKPRHETSHKHVQTVGVIRGRRGNSNYEPSFRSELDGIPWTFQTPATTSSLVDIFFIKIVARMFKANVPGRGAVHNLWPKSMRPSPGSGLLCCFELSSKGVLIHETPEIQVGYIHAVTKLLSEHDMRNEQEDTEYEECHETVDPVPTGYEMVDQLQNQLCHGYNNCINTNMVVPELLPPHCFVDYLSSNELNDLVFDPNSDVLNFDWPMHTTSHDSWYSDSSSTTSISL
jgi:hypothetical protein